MENRLKEGDLILLSDGPYKVVYVNESRARIVPLTAEGHPGNISPYAVVQLVTQDQLRSIMQRETTADVSRARSKPTKNRSSHTRNAKQKKK